MLKKTTIDRYLNFLTRLDKATKKYLIDKLTASLETNRKIDYDISGLHGSWEDTRSSDEIIRDIYSSRIEKEQSINL